MVGRLCYLTCGVACVGCLPRLDDVGDWGGKRVPSAVGSLRILRRPRDVRDWGVKRVTRAVGGLLIPRRPRGVGVRHTRWDTSNGGGLGRSERRERVELNGGRNWFGVLFGGHDSSGFKGLMIAVEEGFRVRSRALREVWPCLLPEVWPKIVFTQDFNCQTWSWFHYFVNLFYYYTVLAPGCSICTPVAI